MFLVCKKKVIKIKLKGGLGNQMFQYAYGRKLILLDKKDVVFDISFFGDARESIDTNRPFLLDKFIINNSIKFENIKENFFQKIVKKIISNITGEYGFYQNEKYFKDIEDVIRKEFTLKDQLSGVSKKAEVEISNSKNSVSIHIRRGDYVTDKNTNIHHGTCGLDYYQNAIKYILDVVESPTFFIFSDDIEWVKENLKIENCVYVSNPEIKDYEELILMSKCRHNIIANSSFSWWGAWLNKTSDKIIVAPKQWLANKTANELDILPSSWIQI